MSPALHTNNNGSLVTTANPSAFYPELSVAATPPSRRSTTPSSIHPHTADAHPQPPTTKSKHAFTMRRIGLNLPAWVVLVMLASKFVGYGSSRMIYSISPFLQADWNVTNTEMGLIVASGEFGSLPAGFFIPFAELAGPRKSVAGMFLLVAVGNALTSVYTAVPYLIVIRFLQSLCLTVFISCLQAAGACMVPPAQNLRLTTVLESGYGMALLVAVPIVGVIYETLGWQAVYLVMAAVMVPVSVGLFMGLPDEFITITDDSESEEETLPDTVGDTGIEYMVVQGDKENGTIVKENGTIVKENGTIVLESKENGTIITNEISDMNMITLVGGEAIPVDNNPLGLVQQQHHKTHDKPTSGVIANVRAVLSVPAVRYNFAGALISQVAISIMFALYSYWARDVHGKDVSETATYTLLLGVAEIFGILALSQLGNNRYFGLYATVIIALAISGVLAVLAGILGGYTFEGGLGGYMLMFVAAEYSTVGGIALVREVAPAKSLLPALGFYYQGMAIGRTIAALVSPLFWENFPELIWAAVWSASVFSLAIALQLRGKYLHHEKSA